MLTEQKSRLADLLARVENRKAQLSDIIKEKLEFELKLNNFQEIYQNVFASYCDRAFEIGFVCQLIKNGDIHISVYKYIQLFPIHPTFLIIGLLFFPTFEGWRTGKNCLFFLISNTKSISKISR